MASRLSFVENFAQPVLLNASIGLNSNLNFELQGTNAANANSTFATGGGNIIATAGANNDQMIIVPHLDTAQSSWAGVTWTSAGEPSFKASIRITGTATVTHCAGFRATATLDVATDDDKIIFRHAAATDGSWHVVESIGGVDVDTTTSISITTGNVDLAIMVNASRVAFCYINGVLVRVSSALTAGSLGVPMIGVQANAVAARNIRLHRLGCAINPVA